MSDYLIAPAGRPGLFRLFSRYGEIGYAVATPKLTFFATVEDAKQYAAEQFEVTEWGATNARDETYSIDEEREPTDVEIYGAGVK